jgi:hypothetical protein
LPVKQAEQEIIISRGGGGFSVNAFRHAAVVHDRATDVTSLLQLPPGAAQRKQQQDGDDDQAGENHARSLR